MTEQEARALYDKFLDLLRTNASEQEMNMFLDSCTDKELDLLGHLLENTKKQVEGGFVRRIPKFFDLTKPP